MTHCLVTFLGFQKSGSYPKARYDFPDGTSRSDAFLGYPLQDYLQADRLVIFGTSGSMWDHLFEGELALQGDESARVEALMEATHQQQVSQQQLDDLAPLLSRTLGCEVWLRIIPAAFDQAEQGQLVQALAEAANGADRLSVDVTHGYRHLPMLVVTAALYLRFVQPGLDIDGLWYGVFDPATRIADVRNIGGLLQTADWLSALQRHDWLGDYNYVADQLQGRADDLPRHLRQASFNESIHQGQRARTSLREARKCLDAQPLQGMGALFEPQLRARIAWVDENRLYQRQRSLARQALARGDYLRASLYGYEAFITQLTQARYPNGQENDHEARQNAREDFKATRQEPEVWQQYKMLEYLRNLLAHGNRPPNRDQQQAIADAGRLHAALETAFDTLLVDANP